MLLRRSIMQEYQEGKKNRKLIIQKFLISFFEDNRGYEFKELNGFILEKWFDNNYHRWMVSVFMPESFKRKQEFWNKQQKLLKE